MRSPEFVRLAAIVLLAEIAFAALNLSTMTLYLVRARELTPAQAGLVLTAFLVSETLFKGISGTWGDRWGITRVVAPAPWLAVISVGLTLAIPIGLPGEFGLVALLRVLDGFAAALLWPNLFALGASLVPADQCQRAMATLNACYLVGVAIAFPLSGWLDDAVRLDWAGPFAIGLLLAAGLFALVGVAMAGLPRGAPTPLSESPEKMPVDLSAFRRIPSYLGLGFVAFMAIGFPLPIVKLFALEEFGISGGQFGAWVAPGAVALAILSPVMTRLGERLGAKRAVRVGLATCALGALAISAGSVEPGFRSPWVFALGAIPIGLGFLLTLPAWLSEVGDLDPQKRASHLGAVMAAQGVGAMTGAPVGAWLYGTTAETRYWPFVATSAALIVAWALSWRLRSPCSDRRSDPS